MILPRSVGDLQVGERCVVFLFWNLFPIVVAVRYANMDYIFASASTRYRVPRIIAGYDVACQWIKTLPKRMEDWPEGDLRRVRDLVAEGWPKQFVYTF